MLIGMAGRAARTHARQRIEQLCRSASDPEQLCSRSIDELRRAVGFDAYCWPLTDPGAATPGLTIAEAPFWADLPQLLRLRHGRNEINRPPRLTSGRRRVTTLDSATGGDPSRSAHWQTSLRKWNIRDELTVVFSDRHGCWGFLDLYRDGSPFSDSDAVLLDELSPLITEALRAASSRTCLATFRQPTRRFDPAVLVLDERLDVVSRTAAADAWLRLLRPMNSSEPEVPGYVFALAGRLDAIAAGLETLPARLRTHVPGRGCVTIRAARLEGTAGGYVVTIEASSPAERIDLLARAAGLTARQRQVAGLVVAGLDTKALADRLYLSEHTVQQHLKSIFAKTHTSSRRELLGLAVGSHND